MHRANRNGNHRAQQGAPKMWSGLFLEDSLTPEVALPAQFHDLWHRSRAIAPEKALAIAVLTQAVLDLYKYRFAKRRRQQRLYMEAYRWVASDDREWPYSFVNLCDALDLSPESLREQLLGPDAPALGLEAEMLEAEEAA
jgi:hypothetical protein